MHNFHTPVVKVRASGVGFPGLLALLFIGLRLAGVIDWHWAWILSPIWIPMALGLVMGVVAGIVFLVVAPKASKSSQL
ncbi:MAG: hypothetical protein FWG74_09925 [Planctomycetes bacterium]|nr:hypothetical protein [Planctomycetota bacterium]